MNAKLHAPDITPSDGQWEAIRCNDEHVLIDAGAGTGKTFTVVAKALYLMGVQIRGETIATPLALHDIAAITYTNKAASELKEKLRSSLRAAGRRRESYQVDTARVGTIHSFCSDILREFALRSGRSPNLALIDEAEGRVLEADVVRDALLRALEDDSVAGLGDLLSVWSVNDVTRWATSLLGHGDNIITLRAVSGGTGAHERTLIDLARQAHTLLMTRLEESGQMDFDRMIVWTRDLLRDNATVRKSLQRRIRVLIIDECQDVDPIQREIAYLLADPTSRRTDTTRLVLVGDPKQSIYRFRKADVTVWRSIEDDFRRSGTGRVVKLAESRRSVPALLAFVDDFVGTLLDRPIDESAGQQNFEVPYASLKALRTESGGDGKDGAAAVELITIPAKESGGMCTAGVVRPIEARAIAARALELRECGFAWRDMAVLLCGWGDVDVYMAALREAGIPAYSLRAQGFWGCREILDVTVALAAILDPSDDRSLLGFLRSPFAGLTDESLLHIARQSSVPYWHKLAGVQLPDPHEHARLSAAIGMLRRLSAIRDRILIARLIEELLGETGYLLHLELLGETSDGTSGQRIANVRKLVRYAGDRSSMTVGDFLRGIQRERDLGIRRGEALLYAENDDVVTVTSVHSAKGLEWKCVFWVDLIRESKRDANKFLAHNNSVALGEPDTKADEQSPEWKAVRAAIDAEELAETKRLWYVAATRAKDLLILSGIPLGTMNKPRARVPADAIRSHFAALDATTGTIEYRGASGITYMATVRHADLVPEIDDSATTEATVSSAQLPPVDTSIIDAITAPWSEVSVASGRGRQSATELMEIQECERRHWLKRVASLPEPSVHVHGGGIGNALLSAAARGVTVHHILEHAEAGSDLGQLYNAAIGRSGEDSEIDFIDPIERDRIIAEVERTVSRPEYRELRDAAGARRELAFTFVDGDSSFQGTLDLVAPLGDGYRLLDVKTGGRTADDAATVENKAARYDLQRTLYSRAVEVLTGGRVTGFTFDFTASGQQADVTLDANTAGQALQRLEIEVARLKEGVSSRTASAGECEFCGYRTAGWCPGT